MNYARSGRVGNKGTVAKLTSALETEHGRCHPADLRIEPYPVVPTISASWGPGDPNWLRDVANALRSRGSRCMIVRGADHLFCFFYTAIQYNPKTAENLKNGGAFIPGYRPGDQTAKYIEKDHHATDAHWAIYITVVCLIPEF